MTISSTERLNYFYQQFVHDDRVLIVINADPDAIACSMAIKRLLWRKVSMVIISNINTVHRPDNIAMIRLLSVHLVHVDEIDRLQFNRIVLVDSQPDHHESFTSFKPDVIIDHHPKTDAIAPFQDIRPQYGATATIMTEYLRAAKIKPSTKLATGLFHAIKTDTSNFERQTLIEDIRAFQFLFKHANVHLARKIEQADLEINFLKYFKIALQDMQMRKNRIFVHLNQVRNPDICVLIADFFMRVHSVNWSIVSGINNSKLIVILRNDGLRKDAGKVAKQSFGQAGRAGGHKSMARAEMPVSELKKIINPNEDKKLVRWIIHQIEKSAKK